MQKYVAQHRNLEHPPRGRKPNELMFNQKVRGKLPDLDLERPVDQAVPDRDSKTKAMSKLQADTKWNACYSDVDLDDQVLVRQDKSDKPDHYICANVAHSGQLGIA